jgi:hypothetical protein
MIPTTTTTTAKATMRHRGVIRRPTQLWLFSLAVILHHHSVLVHVHAQQQPPMQLRQQQQQQRQQQPAAEEANPESLLDPTKCLDGTNNDRSLVDGATISAVATADKSEDEEQPLFIVESAPSTNQDLDDTDDNDEEEDPLLQLLPGTDKKVYVRADVATFYRQPPEVQQPPVKFQAVVNRGNNDGDGAATATIQRKEQEELQPENPLLLVEKEPKFQGQAGKFVNMSPERVQLYWNGGNNKPLVFIANIGPFCAGGTATFPLHKFVLKHAGSSDDNVICDFHIQKGTSVYYYDPYQEPDAENTIDVARCLPRANYTTVRDISELSQENVEKYRAHDYNFQFGALYKNFTGGQEWLSMYPRNPPRHHIYRADYFGQEHTVATTGGTSAWQVP